MELEREKLKALLGISAEDTAQDAVLQFILDDVKETIRNYCGLDEVPDGLTQTAYRMAIDLYRGENVGQVAAPVTIASVTEGDTSTSFGVSSAAAALQGGILKDYRGQLNRYRRLVWS